MGLNEALNHLMKASRISGNKNSYRKDNPSEYAAVKAYIDGGTRPNVTTEMGMGLREVEDVRRSMVPVPPPATGDKFASPSGSDTTGTGTLANPFASVKKLSLSLAPGQVGMLRAGTYGAFTGYNPNNDVNGGGTSGNPITITNYPGEYVLLRGTGGIFGNFITIRNLHFDTTNNQRSDHGCGISALPYDVGGNDIILEYNEVFQSGNNSYPSKLKNSGIYQEAGDRVIYRYNLIHDVGGCQALDHGIYLGHGNNCEVHGNWIWADPHGWGVQIYPECKNGQFHSNVIENCGSGFVICDDVAGGTAGNDVYNNVIANCIADNADKQFGDYAKSSGAGLSGMGTNAQSNNKFRDNIIWNCPAGIAGETEPFWGVHPPPSNITITGNTIANPLFENAAAHDYRVKSGSPAYGFGLPTTKPGPT